MNDILFYLNQLVSKNIKNYLLGLVVLLSITNPSIEEHKNEVIFNIGPMSSDQSEIYRSSVSRGNFLLFSLTKTNLKPKRDWHRKRTGWSRIIGVGILGQVYIFTKPLE